MKSVVPLSSLCLDAALTASMESWLSMCTENAAPMNRGITHHCRLQHVSTAQYTLLTRSDIIRMSQPGLNVSEWLSSPSPSLPLLPRLCLRLFSSAVLHLSPRLPVFCSSGLFSLHVSPPLPLSLPPPPVPPIPPSVADCSHVCVTRSRSGRLVTTPRTGAGSFYHETRRTTAKQLFFTPLSHPLIPLLPATCCLSLASALPCCIFSIIPLAGFAPEINTGC